jgi:DNA-binding LytR/AlgR family response regulator
MQKMDTKTLNGVPQVGIYIRHADAYQRVLYRDILWIEADSNYTIFHTAKREFTVALTLSTIEKKIQHSGLCRIHRSHIVNLLHVDKIMGNMLCIEQLRLPVGKAYRSVLDCFVRF